MTIPLPILDAPAPWFRWPIWTTSGSRSPARSAISTAITASSVAARTITASAFSTWKPSARSSTNRCRLGVKEYYFTGGEPFLHRDMLGHPRTDARVRPRVRADQRHRLQGRMARPRCARAEEASPYSLEFRVSIDGFTAAENDPVRGDGTFERALRGVRQLVAPRLPADHHRGPHPRRPGRRGLVQRLRRAA